MSTITLDISQAYEKKYWVEKIEKHFALNLKNYLFQLELEEDVEECKRTPRSEFKNIQC